MAKSLDLICLGRAGVDLYADQVGSRLEDVASFSKYIGGSSTNIAACSSRMGLKTALISRVGNEHMGRFIREQLNREGVDTSFLATDSERLTAMVVLGIKDRETFPLIFYRENCADMAIDKTDISESFIASSKALVVTGTHLSTPQVHEVSSYALDLARANQVKTVLDIDYRPVLWGLTSRGDGETRFISDDNVSKHLLGILPKFDLIVGTEEEIHIAGGSTDTIEALQAIRAVTQAEIVVKRGPYGASVFTADIPDSLDAGITVKGVTVDVLNVLGAGDAFISGFLRGWVNGEGHEQSLTYANACGALVVSRHGCTPAMPTVPELDYYLNNASDIPRPDLDVELNHLHRVTVRRKNWGELHIHAFDHRAQFIDMARQADAPLARIESLKGLLLSASQQVIQTENIDGQGGILCDGIFGQDTLNAATGSQLWIGRPIEQPKSRPIAFEGGEDVGSTIKSWPLDQIVKCLIYYHPDEDNLSRYTQEKRIQSLYRACCVSGHEWLLEIIPPAGTEDQESALLRSVTRFYNLGVKPDWWKLPCLSREGMQAICQVIEERDPYCHGVVILGLDAPIEQLGEGFKALRGLEQVKGFAVGRTIFGAPSLAWLKGEVDDAELIQQVAKRYTQLIHYWRQR